MNPPAASDRPVDVPGRASTSTEPLDNEQRSGVPVPAEEDEAPRVRAAGGAVWRRGALGLELVLVHRPRYDDWSLPKGKVGKGETDEEAAVREVREEATVVARMGPELTSVRYVDRQGRPKVARYWAMTVVEGSAAGDNEVDRAEWFGLDAAREQLSYPRDHPVLDRLAALDAAGELR